MSAENLGIVLGHLADNALRHGAGRIEISAQVAPGQVRLNVADDGGGISANNRARIFDNFFTTRREQGGTGMGLAIVRAMLGAHGGTIELAGSTKGACFKVTVPLDR